MALQGLVDRYEAALRQLQRDGTMTTPSLAALIDVRDNLHEELRELKAAATLAERVALLERALGTPSNPEPGTALYQIADLQRRIGAKDGP